MITFKNKPIFVSLSKVSSSLLIRTIALHVVRFSGPKVIFIKYLEILRYKSVQYSLYRIIKLKNLLK